MPAPQTEKGVSDASKIQPSTHTDGGGTSRCGVRALGGGNADSHGGAASSAEPP
jgi:hypothetical protein